MKKLVFSMLFLLTAVLIFGITTDDNNPPVENPKGGLIRGTIVESRSKVPMEYTSIALYNLSDSSLYTGTVSGTDGEFRLEDLAVGIYYVEAHFIGYDKQVISPVVIDRDQRFVDLGQLSLSIDSRNLDEVEVVAKQRRVEYKIDKKVVNVGEEITAAGGTAVDVLENTPSVSVDIEGNVTMRGSGNFEVLINGKPTVLDAADALRQIPASSIQNIEIITNPSVKYDPDGSAGIINVVMKKRVEQGTNGIINATVGLKHKYSVDALVNHRVGKANFFIGGGYNDNKYLGSMLREHTSFDDAGDNYNISDGNFHFLRGGSQIKAGMDYDISPRSNLTVEGSGGTYLFGMDMSNEQHVFTNPATVDEYFVNENLNKSTGYFYSGNLSFTHTFDSSDHKIVAMANFSNRSSSGIDGRKYYAADQDYVMLQTEVPDEARNVESGDNSEYRFQVDYTRPIGSGKLEAGYQGRIEDNLGGFEYQEFDPDSKEWNSFGDNSSDISFFRNVQGAYVQYGGSVGKFQYQLGMRGEYTYRLIEYKNFNSEYTINRFDYYPTVHFSRELNNDQQLMLSYSKRVNRPRSWNLDSIPNYIDNQTIRIGNPGLEPEYINSFEFGYQKGWGRNFLAVELFYRNTNNLITRVTEYNESDGIFYQTFKNINEDHSAGTEVMVNWQVAKSVTLNASTSGYYYRLQGELFGEPIDNSNFSWKANTNATFNYSKTGRLQTTIGYQGPSVNAQGSSEGMFYTNLAVRQDFLKRKLSATLQVRDLFGTMKRNFTSSGPGFEQHVIMQHEPRVVMLTLSYKINNYRVDPQSQRRGDGGGMEMEGGF